MICKTCGKEINDNDRFCSACGTLVEPMQPQNFEWNVHNFPGEPVKPTQDTSFDWGIQEGEFRRRPEVAEGFAPDDPMYKFQQQPEQPQQPAQPEQPKQKGGFFSRFTKDKKLTMENPAITEEIIQQSVENQVQQPEQPQQSMAQPVAPQPEVQPQQKPAIQVQHVDFDWEQPVPSTNIPEPVFVTGGGQNELKAEKEDDITGTELERELFGGAAVTGMVDGGEGLSKQTAKIDQFYIFNRKNEEFQKLIDDEYEKFRSGKPLDDSTFAANVEAIKERNTIGMDDKTGVYESMASQLEQAQQPQVSPQPVQPAREEKPKKEKFSFGFLKKDKGDESAAEKEEKKKGKKEKKAKKEAEPMAADANQPEAQNPQAEGEQKAADKQGLVGRIIIIVLSVILALLLIALGLKLIAPDSILSQKIDNVADGVMTIFTGDEEEPEAEAEDPSRDEFTGDLNGVIQTALNDNYNDYIADITYDSGLSYEKKTKNIRIRI